MDINIILTNMNIKRIHHGPGRSTIGPGHGSDSFIGSHLVRSLQAQGRVGVVALDDLSGGDPRNLPAGVEFVEGSVTDHVLLERLFDRLGSAMSTIWPRTAEGLSHFIRRFDPTMSSVAST